MSWLDRILNSPTPEQLILSLLRTSLQLQQETNLLLRELILANGRTPSTLSTPIDPSTVTAMTSIRSNASRPPVDRIRGANDISNTNDPSPAASRRPSVETSEPLPPSDEPE